MEIHDAIYNNFNSKTNEELQKIWDENDRNEYSNDAFEVIEKILKERNVSVNFLKKQIESKKQFKNNKRVKSNMSKSQAEWMIILLCCIVLITGLIYLQSVSSTTKWEYKLEYPDDYDFEIEMNKLGDEGWELVYARRAISANGDANYELILKRKLFFRKTNSNR